MDRKNPKFTFVSKRDKPIVFDLESAISKFLYVKRVAKRSKKTIQTYEQSLNQFCKWLSQREKNEITTDVLLEYIHYLTYEKKCWDDHPTSPTGEDSLSPWSVNNTIRNLRTFFNYAASERLIAYSPMTAIKLQQVDKHTFEVFTDDEVGKLLEQPNQRIYTGLRDYCMMLVLVDTACRCGELTELKISDVNFKLRQITFRAENTKSSVSRTVPISQRTAKALEKLVSFMNVEDVDYLWLTQFGERYFGDTFRKMLKKYGEKAGITVARVSPHTFRHYAAVAMLKGGMNPIQLSRLLGHSTVAVTEIYVRYTEMDMSEVHEIASPVTRLIDKGNEKKRGNKRFK